MEMIKPDERFIEITQAIIEQHNQIIKMNMLLIQSLSNPRIMSKMSDEERNDLLKARNG